MITDTLWLLLPLVGVAAFVVLAGLLIISVIPGAEEPED